MITRRSMVKGSSPDAGVADPLGLYERLSLPNGAPQADVIAAYRRLAKKNHPDVGGSLEAFQKIAEAYHVLSHDLLREEYHSSGRVSENNLQNIRQQAISIIADMFSQALNSGMPDHQIDFIKLMRQASSKHLRELIERQTKNSQEIKKLKRVQKRISCKTNGENIFKKIITAKIGDCEQVNRMIGEQQSQQKMIMAELEGYESMVDIARGSFVVFSTATTTSTTATG